MVSSAYDTTEAPPHSSTDQEIEHEPLIRRFWLLRQALKSGSSMAEALKIAEKSKHSWSSELLRGRQ